MSATLARLTACAFALGACRAPAAPAPINAHRVLFIGNSLTYFNDLPGLVSALADSAGVGPVVTASVALPAYSLEDHWNDGRAAAEIARGGWDVVVLQQGPSALPASRELLLDYAARFDRLIRAVGATPAMYMVWPSRQRFDDFDRVSESYRLAARAIDGVLLPAGEAWRAAWRRDSTLALYDIDKLHPSALGTYLAALVMVQRLNGGTPPGPPVSVALPSGIRFDVPPDIGHLLQSAAAEANARY